MYSRAQNAMIECVLMNLFGKMWIFADNAHPFVVYANDIFAQQRLFLNAIHVQKIAVLNVTSRTTVKSALMKNRTKTLLELQVVPPHLDLAPLLQHVIFSLQLCVCRDVFWLSTRLRGLAA